MADETPHRRGRIGSIFLRLVLLVLAGLLLIAAQAIIRYRDARGLDRIRPLQPAVQPTSLGEPNAASHADDL